jgi:uncharacterized protein (DUF488 family)
MSGPILTVGHSTRTAEGFLDLLRAAAVEVLVDVRRFPASRRHPHFAAVALRALLHAHDIAYEHEPDLGGRRAAQPLSPNTAWRNPAFRGYADHMATPAFAQALERVRARATRERVAVMCAEAVPWRCHRQLIADALVAGGHDVLHLLGPGQSRPHQLHPQARLEPTGRVIYPLAGAVQQPLPGVGLDGKKARAKAVRPAPGEGRHKP